MNPERIGATELRGHGDLTLMLLNVNTTEDLGQAEDLLRAGGATPQSR